MRLGGTCSEREGRGRYGELWDMGYEAKDGAISRTLGSVE